MIWSDLIDSILPTPIIQSMNRILIEVLLKDLHKWKHSKMKNFFVIFIILILVFEKDNPKKQ